MIYKKYSNLIILCIILFVNLSIQEARFKPANVRESLAKKEIDTIEKVIGDKPQIVSVKPDKDVKIILAKEVATASDNSKWLIPLLSLILGFMLNKIYDFFTSKFRISKAGRRWLIELENITNLIPDQIENLKAFKEIAGKDEISKPVLFLNSTIRGEIFTSLDKNDLLKYIEVKYLTTAYYFQGTKNKLKTYQKLIEITTNTHNHLSRLNHYYEMTQKRYNDYLEGISVQTAALNISLQNFVIDQRSYFLLLERHPNPENDKRVAKMTELYKNILYPLMKGEIALNPPQLRDEYFVVLSTILVPVRHEEKVEELLDSVNRCLNSIAALNAERDYITTNIDTLVERYTSLIAEGNSIIKAVRRENA